MKKKYKIKILFFCCLLTCQCKKDEDITKRYSPVNHLVPNTDCRLLEVQWLSDIEDDRHLRLFYNEKNLISKIVNLDSNRNEDPDHYWLCNYDEEGKIINIVYAHFEYINGQRVLRKNIRSFEYQNDDLVRAVNVNNYDTNDEIVRCTYTYDSEGEILQRVCQGTINNTFLKDSTHFIGYEKGRPKSELQYVCYKNDSGAYDNYHLQNEYQYTYDKNANLIKKDFRRNASEPFEIKFLSTFDTTQINPVAEILHIIDEITLSWHENPNMHTRDMNKNFKTSTSFFIEHSMKDGTGKRKNVRFIHTDTLYNTLFDKKGMVSEKKYYYKQSHIKEDPKHMLTMKFNYSCN